MKDRAEYKLGVKRKIKTKRGTGTRDQDEVETTARFKSLDQLEEHSEDIIENHSEAVRDARKLSDSGRVDEDT